VIPGGLGDYFASQAVINYLQDQFPSFSFYFIALMHTSSPHTLLQKKDSDHILLFSSPEDILPQTFPSHVLEKLRNADIILQIPTLYPHLDQLLPLLQHKCYPTVTTIGEYGFICSPPFYPNTDTRCLGLHFLELGMLLAKAKASMTLAQVKDKNLLSLLLGSHSIERYLHTTNLYFGYLCTEQGFVCYLQAVLAAALPSPSNIDICLVDIGPLLPKLSSMQPLLQQSGIKTLEIFYKGSLSTFPVQAEGKHLRIIHTGSLDHETFQLLMHISSDPVGVRGNLSLSEAVASDKAYIYDPLEHNMTLYHGLLSIAKAHTKVAAQLLEHGKSFSFAKALQELKILNKKLQQEHNALPHIANLVAKLLLHRKKTSMKKQESLLTEAFAAGSISLETCLTHIKKLITI